MWELDSEESWALKNWCFWTLALEKTLESPLGCKEIQPVHHKWDQSWVFIGRTDAEVETPVLWPPHAKSWLIGKDLGAGRDWRQEEKGTTEDEMAGWHHQLNAHFEWTLGVGDGRGAWRAVIHGVAKSRTRLRDWTELNWSAFLPSWYCLWLKVSSDVLPMFENIELFVFLMLSFESSLFWMCLLSEIGFTSVFCLFVSFIFLKVSFKEQKCLLMMKSNLSICSFTSHAFGVSSKSLICYQPKTTKFLFLCFLLVVL